MKKFNRVLSSLLVILIALSAASADAAIKKKSKKKSTIKQKQTTKIASPYVIEIGYPTTSAAYSAIKARTDVQTKTNNQPFGWQQRGGNWYVANEPNHLKNQADFEWAFTMPGHYAHPSVVKRMIDVGSKDHVYVDMAFRCGAPDRTNCDKLSSEFKEVNLLIRKVYQKQYIHSEDGTAAWDGPTSLE